MPPNIDHRRAAAQAQDWLRTALREFYRQMHRNIAGVLLQYAGADGKVALRNQPALRREVGLIVLQMFGGNDGRGAFAEDGETAQSPYARIINEGYVRMVVGVVEVHHAWLKRYIPADVLSWLTRLVRPLSIPTTEQHHRLQVDSALYARIAEAKWQSKLPDDYPVLHTNPLAEIDPSRQWVPMHRWTDERGYRLSDRIWRTSEETRRKIDEVLAKALLNGDSAADISDMLERYLQVGREGIRTIKPYEKKYLGDATLAYDGMRLARTELARAGNQAAFTSAYLNPYVSGIDVRRSAQGDKNCKICPQHATIGIDGKRIRPAYPTTAAHIPPYHPHDMCSVIGAVTDTPAKVTADLRAFMADANQLTLPVTTPAQKDEFIEQLLGNGLAKFLTKVRQGRLW
jgi:hypothetical protein